MNQCDYNVIQHPEADVPYFSIVESVINDKKRLVVKNSFRISKIKAMPSKISLSFLLVPFKRHIQCNYNT